MTQGGIVPATVMAEVAAGAAQDSGGLSVDLLGDFLTVLGGAVAHGRPITSRQLRPYRALADDAARQGVALRALLDLYLSAAWRLWRQLPAVASEAATAAGVATAGEVMLHAVDDVVAELAEGYQLARRALVRAQESSRREFIDDLLSGAADVAGVLARAGGFGMDLSGPHAVAVIHAEQPIGHAAPVVTSLERAILGSKGDAHALLATKHGRLVVVFPAPDRVAVDHVTAQIRLTLGTRPGEVDGVRLRRRSAHGGWQVGVGRPGVGVDGVVTSYGEAREALELAGRLGFDHPFVYARDLLVYQVLLRDQVALADLIRSTLTPLGEARGGAGPLLETLTAYFDSGANSARTARSLHLSVRALTYRLDRVRELTGHDPARPQDALTLQIAVLGAKLLNWPGTALS